MSLKNTMPLSNRHFRNTVFTCRKPNRFSLIFFEVSWPEKKHVHTAFSTVLLLIAKEFAVSISINGRDGGIEHIPATTCYTAAKMNEPDMQQSKQVSRDSLMSEKSPFQSENSSVILFMLEM